jgi:hypothetical protein
LLINRAFVVTADLYDRITTDNDPDLGDIHDMVSFLTGTSSGDCRFVACNDCGFVACNDCGFVACNELTTFFFNFLLMMIIPWM